MTNFKLMLAKYGNQNALRMVFVLAALLALALAAGAPDCTGVGHCP